jgi:hypothetical protein
LGTYVRWTVNTAWSAFESTCEDVLKASGLGYDFKGGFNRAADAQGVQRPDWGSGDWQNVLKVYELRKDYVHLRIPQSRLFAPLSEAEDAVTILRAAVKALYRRAGLSSPGWVDDDVNPIEPTCIGHLTVTHPGASRSDPNCIRVTYLYRGSEHESAIFPPGTDPQLPMEELLRKIIVPIRAIRAYRGDHLLEEWQLNMRGS